MSIDQLRHAVTGLLHRFGEAAVRDVWLSGQVALWDCPPETVLSLIVNQRTPAGGAFALTATQPHDQRWDDRWEVLGPMLLTSSPVWLVDSNARPPRLERDWTSAAESLAGLLEELDFPLPVLPVRWGGEGQWAERVTSALVLEVCSRITKDPRTTGIGCALVWRTLGFTVDPASIPTPTGVGDPIDGWHDVLDTLTAAQSAAATVLAVLAVEGGGREVRRPALIKEGTSI